MDLPAALLLVASFWLSLPHGDTASDLLETVVPFTFTDAMNTGGVITGNPLLSGSNGMSWSGTTFRLDRLDITDLGSGGRPLLYADLSMLERVHVTETGAAIDVGSPGPTVSLLPRRAAASWRGEAALALSPSALQDAGPSSPPAIVRLRSLTRADGSAGGGLGTAGTRLFIAAGTTRSTHHERDVATDLAGNAGWLYSNVSAREGTANDWTISGWTQQVTRPFAARARFADPDVLEHDRYIGLVTTWQQGERRPWRIDAGIQSMRVSAGGTTARANGTIERLRDGPVQELVAYAPGTHSRIGVDASVEPMSVGRHMIRAGLNASYAGIRATPLGTGLIGETVAGLPSRAWNYRFATTDDRHTYIVTGFGSDRIGLGDDLSLDLGIRIEDVSASNSAESIGWTTIAPAAAVSYAPGDWVFFGSARRYHPPVTLDLLAYGDPSAPSASVYRWTDANGDRIAQSGELGPLIAAVGPAGTASAIDTSLRRPHVDEALLGVERKLGTHWSIEFSGVSRRKRDVVGVVNTGVPFDAYSVTHVFDPGLDLLGGEDDQMLPIYSRPVATFGQDQYLLTNIPSVTSTFSVLYIGVVARGYDRWNLVAGASALRTKAPAGYRGFGPLENDDSVAGDAFSDPNSNTYAMGRLLFDRGYAAKVAASFRAPHAISLGTVARYEDGQPFARLVLAPDLPQGPDVVRAYQNGLSRFTYTLTLDVRVAKDIAIGRSAVTLALEAFNALNTQHEVEENVLTGSSYRATTAVQPPRVIRLEVRFGF
jgi:hypothetical protein